MITKRAKKGPVQRAAFIILATAALITVATTKGALIPAFAQSSSQVCANAVFTPSLPQAFTNGTSIPFTVDFGVSFSTVSGAAAISTFDAADAFGNGDRYFIDNFAGEGSQPGTPEITSMTVNVVDPTTLSQFLNVTFKENT